MDEYNRGNNAYNNPNSNNNFHSQNNSGNSNSSNSGNWSNNNGYNKNNYNKSGSNFKRPPPLTEEDIRLYKPYVGTGNKDAPPHINSQIKNLVKELEKYGYILRTGGMDGVEETFEASVSNPSPHTLELHIPWRDFNEKDSKLYFNSPLVLAIAKIFHTGFDNLKPAIQAFLGKNVRLILGKDIRSPAMFMVCWSDDGAESLIEKTSKTGNVGHAIAVAASMKIPVFNLAKPDAIPRLRKYLNLPEPIVETVSEI